MKKCNELSQALLEAYNEKVRGLRHPKIQSSYAEYGSGEGFELSYAGGILHARAQSALAEVYALSLLNVVVPSGHWQEFLGASQPRFPLRPLWVRTAPVSAAAFHYACRRAAELGYNAVVWDGSGDWQRIPSEYGLKAILTQPLTRGDMHAVSYILYEGTVLQPAGNLTIAESVLREVRQQEAALPAGVNLIYSVPFIENLLPEQMASLTLSLHRETAPGTCIAFSAVAGDPTHDHLPINPFWELLRRTPQLHGTGLLPIYNAGGIRQGEGLWPGVCLDQAASLQQRCRRHSFFGGISLVNLVPMEGGFLDANLWVMGQSMWREISPALLLETWLRAHKPEAMLAQTMHILKEVRESIVLLGKLQMQPNEGTVQDENRLMAEMILLRLRGIEMTAMELAKRRAGKSAKATVGDYLIFFLRDVKRLLKPYLTSAKIDDDAQESLWTKAGAEGGRKGLLLDLPHRSQTNAKASQIFTENR